MLDSHLPWCSGQVYGVIVGSFTIRHGCVGVTWVVLSLSQLHGECNE